MILIVVVPVLFAFDRSIGDSFERANDIVNSQLFVSLFVRNHL